jgi:hypothetical protein
MMLGIRTLLRKWFSFFKREHFFKFLFIPAWLMLGIARLAVLLVKFTNIAPFLGCSAPITKMPLQPCIVNDSNIKRIRQISRLILTTARYCPWKANCFAQAIVARFFLGWFSLPYQIYFGLRRDDGQLKAHAWVVSGVDYVTGGNGFTDHTVVGCYCHKKKCKDKVNHP